MSAVSVGSWGGIGFSSWNAPSPVTDVLVQNTGCSPVMRTKGEKPRLLRMLGQRMGGRPGRLRYNIEGAPVRFGIPRHPAMDAYINKAGPIFLKALQSNSYLMRFQAVIKKIESRQNLCLPAELHFILFAEYMTTDGFYNGAGANPLIGGCFRIIIINRAAGGIHAV